MLFTPQKKIVEGKREAFALALELSAAAVLADDTGAMVEARRLHITIIPTFAILETAAKDKLLDLSEVLEKLSHTTFRLPPSDIIEAVFERDAERKLKERPTRRRIGRLEWAGLGCLFSCARRGARRFMLIVPT